MTKRVNSRKLPVAHWDAHCAYGGLDVPAAWADAPRHGNRSPNELSNRVRLCPHCLKRCPVCQHAMAKRVVDLKAPDQSQTCSGCNAWLILWLDWDGSTEWWGHVRSVSFRPYSAWSDFRAACVERLRATRHVVFREWAKGPRPLALAYFCEDSRTARSLRKCRKSQLPHCSPPWVQFIGSWGILYFSFEESTDSPKRRECVLGCLQALGRFRIHFEP